MKVICPECKGMGFVSTHSENYESVGTRICSKCHGIRTIDDGISFDERSLILKYVTFKLKDIKRLCPRGQAEFWSLAKRIFKLGIAKTKEVNDAISSV